MPSEVSFVPKKDPMFKILVKYIKSTTLCRGFVDKHYIRNSAVANADFLIVSYNIKNPTRSKAPFVNLNGFALMNKKPDHLYLDVICAKPGVGKGIIDEVSKQVIMHKKKYLVLSAVTYVINYYKKLGFFHGKRKCSTSNNMKNVEERTRHLKFKDDDNALKNKDFRKLLLVLVKKKMTTEKCKTVPKCAEYGFVMTKCFS